MARMNMNCSFVDCIWMPSSPKPFKKAAGLCDTDHQNLLRYSNASVHFLATRISRTDRSTANTSLPATYKQPCASQQPRMSLSTSTPPGRVALPQDSPSTWPAGLHTCMAQKKWPGSHICFIRWGRVQSLTMLYFLAVWSLSLNLSLSLLLCERGL